MDTIDQDPRHVIPDICERDINHMIFLVNLSNEYIGIVEKTPESVFILRGGTFSGGIVTWSPRSRSLIGMLCKIWNEYVSFSTIIVYVIDNRQELDHLIDRIHVKNFSVIENAKLKLTLMGK